MSKTRFFTIRKKSTLEFSDLFPHYFTNTQYCYIQCLYFNKYIFLFTTFHHRSTISRTMFNTIVRSTRKIFRIPHRFKRRLVFGSIVTSLVVFPYLPSSSIINCWPVTQSLLKQNFSRVGLWSSITVFLC